MPYLEKFDIDTQNGYLGQGIMPTAVMCIRDFETNKILAVHSKVQDALIGLPMTDITQLDPASNGYPAETIEHYARYRMKRFGAIVLKEDMFWDGYATRISKPISDMRNPGFNHCTRRVILPLSGSIEFDPSKLTERNGAILVLAHDDEVLASLDNTSDRDKKQLRQAFKHVLSASLVDSL